MKIKLTKNEIFVFKYNIVVVMVNNGFSNHGNQSNSLTIVPLHHYILTFIAGIYYDNKVTTINEVKWFQFHEFSLFSLLVRSVHDDVINLQNLKEKKIKLTNKR